MCRDILFKLPALSLLCALPLAAADGRIPVATAPYIIGAPGHYYLTQDLSVASGNAITITSGNVTLDLNGHVLATGTAGGAAVSISNANNVRVTGGTLAGGYFGLQYTDSGLIGPPSVVRIDHLRVTGAGRYGIAVSGNATRNVRAVVEFNEITPAAGACLVALYAYYLRGGRLSDNLVGGCTFDPSNGTNLGLFNSTGVEIARNSLADTTYVGMAVQGTSRCNIHHNEITGSVVGLAFFTSDSNVIEGNVITGNTSAAFQLSSGNNNIYANNRYTGNGTNGMVLGGGTTGNQSGGGNCAPAPGGCS